MARAPDGRLSERGRREVAAVLEFVYQKLDENGHKPDLGVESPARWWAKWDEEYQELGYQKDAVHAAWLRADTGALEREQRELMREVADNIICLVNLATHSHTIYRLPREERA